MFPPKLLRVVNTAFPKNNIFRAQAEQMVSFGAVVLTTAAVKFCIENDQPWLKGEVIDENNWPIGRGAPIDQNGLPDHFILQRERYADFIGVSCTMTTGAPRAIALIRFYRSLPENLRPKAILVGGWHAMDNPKEMLEAGADVVVHGEAEAIIKDLLTALRDNKSLDGIPGISYWSDGRIKRNGPDEIFVPQEMMDELPDPDFGLVRYSKIKIYPIGRTRGCDGKCTFCRVNCPPRSISPERFLEQIIILISKGARDIFITDDRSEQDLKGYAVWLKGLADFIQKRHVHVSLTTQNRLSLAEHPEILKLMRAAGVDNVALGCESPIPEQLIAMKKPIKPSEMLNYIRIWKKHGFSVHEMFIFGYPLPPEAREYLKKHNKRSKWSAKELAEIFWGFIKKTKPHTLQVLILTPLPGTPDRKFLEDEERILPLGWEYYDGTWLLFRPDEGTDGGELQKEYIKMMRKFYAFNYLWALRFVPLWIHWFNVGLVTISWPLLRPIIGARRWAKVWWNSLRRLAGHRIISDWLRNFRKLRFIENLTAMIKRRNI